METTNLKNFTTVTQNTIVRNTDSTTPIVTYDQVAVELLGTNSLNRSYTSLETRLLQFVEKDGTKVLSDINFSNALNAKLNGIEENANCYVLPKSSPETLGGVCIENNGSFGYSAETGKLGLTVDNSLNANSTNPVQNKAICDEISDLRVEISEAEMSDDDKAALNGSLKFVGIRRDPDTSVLAYETITNALTKSIYPIPEADILGDGSGRNGLMSGEDKVALNGLISKIDDLDNALDEAEDHELQARQSMENAQAAKNAIDSTLEEVASQGESAVIAAQGAKINELDTKINIIQDSKEIIDVVQNGFYVADVNNDILIKYDENGLDVNKVSEHFKDLVKSTSTTVIGKAKSFPAIPTPMFNDVPVIKITSTALTANSVNHVISELNTTKNKVGVDGEGNINGSVKIEFKSNTLNFEDNISIAYQGNSTLNYPKKGFAIKCTNKHKFGNWLENKSFHLKAYYTDWTHARDAVANWMIEQMYRSRKSGNYRPYLKYNDFTSNNILKYADVGAVSHTDQFPVKLYINDIFWGLYSVVTKKDVENYGMNKSNSNHIMIDVDEWKVLSSMLWSGAEIRCPEGLKAASGADYDGDHPSDLSQTDTLSAAVRSKVIVWNNFMNGISSSTTKSQIESHLNIEEYIDHLMYSKFTRDADKWRKNTLYCSWDGVRFAPLVYDCDAAFGVGWAGYNKFNDATITTSAEMNTGLSNKNEIIDNLYKDEIKARYHELRDSGVFSVENIINLFKVYMLWVGHDLYKKDMEIWKYSTFGGAALNGATGSAFYFGLSNLTTWLTTRIASLDNLYNYNN